MHRQKERYQRLMALLVLGVVLFTPPLLLVFNRPVRVLGLPLLLLYLFLAWGALVALAHRDTELAPREGRHLRGQKGLERASSRCAGSGMFQEGGTWRGRESPETSGLC